MIARLRPIAVVAALFALGGAPALAQEDSVLQRYDSNLRLYNHKPGTLLDLEEELHARTGGYMDTLDQLICQTAQEAIEDGTEAITKEALDNMIVGRNDSNED